MSELRADATTPSFFDLYRSGSATADDFESYVGRWHDAYEGHDEYPPLHEYLGLTRREYEVLMYDPFALPCILRARQPGEDLVAIIAERYARLREADRREDSTIIFSLGHWLQRQARK